MVSRYFGVIFVLFFVMVSVDAKGTSTILIASPTISVNSSENATTPPSSPAVISTSLLVSTTLAANTSSTSPAPSSTAHVIPSASPTTTPSTKAPTKTPKPHGKPTKGRSFDAASFFGGIILGVIVAIACFVGYAWWQNKRKSYHSL